jgi:hypothetical protein
METTEQRWLGLGWHWFWFLPLCALVLGGECAVAVIRNKKGQFAAGWHGGPILFRYKNGYRDAEAIGHRT